MIEPFSQTKIAKPYICNNSIFLLSLFFIYLFIFAFTNNFEIRLLPDKINCLKIQMKNQKMSKML